MSCGLSADWTDTATAYRQEIIPMNNISTSSVEHPDPTLEVVEPAQPTVVRCADPGASKYAAADAACVRARL